MLPIKGESKSHTENHQTILVPCVPREEPCFLGGCSGARCSTSQGCIQCGHFHARCSHCQRKLTHWLSAPWGRLGSPEQKAEAVVGNRQRIMEQMWVMGKKCGRECACSWLCVGGWVWSELSSYSRSANIDLNIDRNR